MNAKSVTLEEFLANDYESYEYIKGDLVPMGDPTMEHGELSSNLVIYSDLHTSASIGANLYGRNYVPNRTRWT